MQPDIAYTAGLIGDVTRSRILTALMGGKALTATELSLEAEVTAQTASSHLQKLVAGGLLQVRKQGRHKYFQLNGSEIAELLESLLTLSAAPAQLKIMTGPADSDLRRARVCYDHLAGELSVLLFDTLVKQQYLVDGGQQAQLTANGMEFFSRQGAEVTQWQSAKRPVCKPCLDWSERRSHLAGALGQWVLNDIFTQGWGQRALDSRAVHFTPNGLQAFSRKYGL